MSDYETPPTETPEPPEPSRGGIPSYVKIGSVFAVLAGVVGVLLLSGGADEAFVYSKLVHEVTEDPAEFEGRQLRVEGDLKQGSVQFREDPCEWRFVLTKEGEEMTVEFPQCVVPDTFRDDMGISVVVEGKIHRDGTFTASQVIPRCPSKYDPAEHQQKNGQGEQPSYQQRPEAS